MSPLRTTNYPRPAPVPADPTLAAIFAEIDERRLSYGPLERCVGVNHGSIRRWRIGESRPRLDNVQPLVLVLGLELRVVTK